MPTITLMSTKGTKVGEVDLNARVFGSDLNMTLMHQAVVEELANQRSGTSDTKTRADVAGGGRKPFRQKGTGRARQGSIRAPHWPGGGVVFGPHPRSYDQHMPRKMRKCALRSALSAKLADGEIIVIEDLVLESVSTKTLVGILSDIGANGRVLVAVSEMTEELAKSSRNIAGLTVRVAPALGVAEIIDSEKIVLTKAAAEKLGEVFEK